MKFAIYQIATAILSLLFLLFSLRQFIKGKSGLIETFLWSFFWVIFIFLSLFPDQLSSSIAHALGIKSNINAVIFLALGVMFFILYRMNSTIRRQNDRITELVRKLAIREEEEPQK